MGKTIDAIGLVVNLEQVHRSAFCPLCVCVWEREREREREREKVWLIGSLSACASGKQKKEAKSVQACVETEMCARVGVRRDTLLQI